MSRALVLALVLAACGGAPPPPTLEDLDTTTMEPLVRETIDEARAAAEAKPESAEAWAHLGFVLDAHRLLPHAEAALAHAIALDDSEFPVVYDHAVVGALLGREPEELLARFDASLALNADYAPLYVRRGDALNQTGRTEEALAAFDRALVLDPSSLHAAASKGRALVDLGLAEEALPLLRRVIAAAPDDRPSQAALARALTLVGEGEAGQAAAERAEVLGGSTVPVRDSVRAQILDLGRASWVNYQRAKRLQQEGDLRGAERWMAEVAAAQPGDFRVRIELAQLQMTLMNLEAARGHLEAVLAGVSDHPGAHALLGQLEVIEGKPAEGLAHFEAAGRTVERFGPSTHLAWASALASAERWREAADQYALAAELMPGHGGPLLQQALALIEAGQFDSARRAYDAGRVLAPDHPLTRAIEERLAR